MAGLYVKRRFGVRWLADFRDPWMAGQFLPRKSHWLGRLARFGESRVYSSADGIIVNAPNAIKAVTAVHSRHAEKVVCVTNGYDPALFHGLVRSKNSKTVITHTGEIYAGRDPRPFLDAVKTFVVSDSNARKCLSIEFVGSTASAGLNLQAEIDNRGLSDIVRMIGSVPYRQSLQRMVDSDVLLLIDSADRKLGVPAKLYEYIGAKRPILALASLQSDVHWVLQESGRDFRLAQTDNVPAICQALKNLLHDSGTSAGLKDADAFSRQSTAATLSTIMDRFAKTQHSSDRHSVTESVVAVSKGGPESW
jgi:glycosyltransferase involved in cell wall biosynthesis